MFDRYQKGQIILRHTERYIIKFCLIQTFAIAKECILSKNQFIQLNILKLNFCKIEQRAIISKYNSKNFHTILYILNIGSD